VKNWFKSIFKPKECALLPWEEEFRNYYNHFQELLRVRRKLLGLLAPEATANIQVIIDLSQRLADLLNKIFDQKLTELSRVSPLFREAHSKEDLENIFRTALAAPDFSECRHVMPESFRRLHPKNLTEYLAWIYELSLEEMFSLLDIYDLRQIKAVPVQTGLPIKLHVIDLGGGVCATDAKMVGKDEILSAPMQAMFKGMYHPGISWSGPIGVNLKGFMVIMAQSSSRPEEDFWDKTYLLAAGDYMNFNSRLGYHYTSVASWLSDEPLDNHIRFTLKGGAADDIRRARRARFIGQVLERLGFEVHVHKDLIEGRLTNTDRALTADRLDLIGRLMGCVRQRDMVMNSDATVNWYAEAFLRGNYSFDPDQ
jgi:pyruvate,water dikinase